jgi:hypothetical protein
MLQPRTPSENGRDVMEAELAAASPVAADEARATIFSQHETIRILLRAAGTVADLAAGGDRRVGDLLFHYLDNVRTALEHHLSLEERILGPVLAADPPLGPERARRLHEEHRRQRAELAALASEDGSPAEAVAGRLRTLVDAFLADMDDEERVLLGRDVLRDDLVSVDQDCG